MRLLVDDDPKDIRAARVALGLSQEALAHALGVSFALVNRWENGRTQPSRLALRAVKMLLELRRRRPRGGSGEAEKTRKTGT
mgnify:CR=1 FL=1